MKEEALFEAALGMEKPWYVEGVEFTPEQSRLDIKLNYPRGSRFPCPRCGHLSPVHDRQERTWRHLNFFQHEAYLHARVPRVKCPEHKVQTAQVPWARANAGFTLLYEALVMLLVRSGMTIKATGRVVGEYDTRVWRIVHHYVDEARADEDYAQVRQVGVDETSSAKGHEYVTVFMDLEERRVLFATEGKDSATLKKFKEDLQAHQGKPEQVEEFCLDMSPAFQTGIGTQFPGARLTFDQFHLMQLMNKAVDEVRRGEQKERPELKGTRYVWLKNEWNHTRSQREVFARLRDGNLKTARAYHIRSVFQDIFDCDDPTAAEDLLQDWYTWAVHSRLEPIVKVAKTMKNHWEGIIRWFRSKINNGILEGMNSLIQAAKARARGFRSMRNLIATIYLVGGKLKFNLPSPVPPTHYR